VAASLLRREADAEYVGRVPENLNGDWATKALLQHGADPIDMGVLHGLLLRWGQARMSQILALWTFLGSGDVGCRPAATDALQLWGPAASGKTSILKDYLNTMQVQSVWLNCACFPSIGELNGRLVELVRQEALKVVDSTPIVDSTPTRGRSRSPRRKELRGASTANSCENMTPPRPEGRVSSTEWMRENATQSSAPRALDKLLRSLQGPLEALSRSRQGATKPFPLIIVFDQAQELQRLGASFERCLRLPSMVRQSGQVVVVTISRLPLQYLGLNPLREPPAVAFPGYAASEAAGVCFEAIQQSGLRNRKRPPGGSRGNHLPDPDAALRSYARFLTAEDTKPLAAASTRSYHTITRLRCQVLENSAFVKMATHRVGKNYSMLLGVANDTVHDWQVRDAASMQQVVERACKRRLALCDMSHLPSDSGSGSLSLMEKRTLVATFLASYVPKDDDGQLFLPMGQRRKRRVLKRNSSASMEGCPNASSTPIAARHPQTSSLIRVMAILSKITQQPQTVGQQVLQALMHLKDIGLVRFVGDKSYAEKDAKVISCTKLPMVRACAVELGIDLPEYLVTR